MEIIIPIAYEGSSNIVDIADVLALIMVYEGEVLTYEDEVLYYE